MARRDGEELVKIVRSIITGDPDPASLRELAEVVNAQMSPYSSSLDNAQFQELRTTMSKSQAVTINMVYSGDGRECKDSIRRLSVLTARPVVDGANSYIMVRPNVFRSTAAGTKGTLFHMNPFNQFSSEFQSQGEQVKLIPRLVQTWDGVEVIFQKGPELLVDYFTLILRTEKKIMLSTRCDTLEYNQYYVSNNSLVELPFYCSAFSPERIFLCPTYMRKREED